MNEKIQKLLEIRKRIKQKKPKFIRQEGHKIKRLGLKWRFPKGMHSKLRRQFKAHRKLPSIGYSSPKEVRGLTREGYRLVLIHNLNELKQVVEKQKIDELLMPLIASKVGKKKRLEIAKYALENNIKIYNLKPKRFIKDYEFELKIKKLKKESKDNKKQESQHKEIKETKKQTETSTETGKEKEQKESKKLKQETKDNNKESKIKSQNIKSKKKQKSEINKQTKKETIKDIDESKKESKKLDSKELKKESKKKITNKKK